MKKRIISLLLAGMLLSSCATRTSPAGPKTSDLIARVPEVQAIVDRLDFVIEAQRRAVAAELVATKHAAGAIADPTVKQAVTMSVDSAQAQLGAEPDPEKTTAAIERVDLVLAGKIDEAGKKYETAAEDAAKVIAGATKDREERDRKLAEAVMLAASAKTENEALVAKFEQEKKAAVEKARNEFMRWLNLGLLGFAGVCYLVAAATAYLSSGKEWFRAGIAAIVGSAAILSWSEYPSMPGSMTSRISTSGLTFAISSQAWRPLSQVCTSKPPCSRVYFTRFSISGSSSITRTFLAMGGEYQFPPASVNAWPQPL